jgi:erythritol kinase
MMAAVAIGAYSSMDDCIADWVTPLLGDAEVPDGDEAFRLDRLYSAYVDVRQAIAPAWDKLAMRAGSPATGGRQSN